ncbi:MAG: ribonuclease III [Patescibacteria group bacterium]
MIDFSKFEKKVKVSFKDKNLLKQAFVHRSYINENPRAGIGHNERMEFLGDAVLELSVTDYLYQKYPDKTEGDLTSYRASLVNAEIISSAALELGMNDYLLLSKGEAKDVGKARQYILANVFESFVGALYLDQGYEAADKFIGKSLFNKIDEIVEKGLFRDAKSFIQEKAQEHLGVTPSYKVMKEIGPDHDKMFTVGIYFGDDFIGNGSGKSKQEAEQKAAQNALKVRGWNGE